MNWKLTIALLLPLACGPAPQEAAVETPVLHHAAPLSPPEPSVISIPLRVSLASVGKVAEQGVPLTSKGTQRERGFDISWQTKRTPLQLRMIGRGLHTRTSILYGVSACAKPLPCISCGVEQSPRRIDVALQSRIEWTSAWRMHSQTSPLPPSFPVACEITPLRIDVTERFIAPVVRAQLAKAAGQIDATIARQGDMRTRAEKVWSGLQRPYEIAPRTWFVLEPRSVSLSPIEGSGDLVGSTLTIEALTRIDIGARPPASARPLPSLRVAPAPPGTVRIPVDVSLPWNEATRVVSTQLAGKPMKSGSGELRIESLTLAPENGTRVRAHASIDYRAGLLSSYRGTIAFVGTPRLSPDGLSLTFPDLDYVLGADAGFLARTADRFSHNELRNRIRESLRIDLRPEIASIRTELTRALQRELAPGVQMSGRVDDINVKSLATTSTGIALRVLATGAAEVIAR